MAITAASCRRSWHGSKPPPADMPENRRSASSTRHQSFSRDAPSCARCPRARRASPPAPMRRALRHEYTGCTTQATVSAVTRVLGADDGIRTRDPHLGKAASGVHGVRSRTVSCDFVLQVLQHARTVRSVVERSTSGDRSNPMTSPACAPSSGCSSQNAANARTLRGAASWPDVQAAQRRRVTLP